MNAPLEITPYIPEVDVQFIGGVCFRKMIFPPDFIGLKEMHDYEHASICASGSGHLLIDGERVPFKAGDLITVKAGVEHAVMTDTETVWYCVFSGEL